VTDQYADGLLAAEERVARFRKLFSRIAGIVLALVGIVALVIGAVLLASQRWPLVRATVQSCQTHVTDTGSSRSSTTDCAMVWQDDAGIHTATVGFGGQGPRTPTVGIRVHGSTAVEATPLWLPWGVLGVGVGLAGAGGVVFARSLRRRPGS